MRTTLTIDDDILRAARTLADSSGESLGVVISRLARNSLTFQVEGGAFDPELGIELLPRRPGSRPVTLELVNALRDDME